MYSKQYVLSSVYIIHYLLYHSLIGTLSILPQLPNLSAPPPTQAPDADHRQPPPNNRSYLLGHHAILSGYHAILPGYHAILPGYHAISPGSEGFHLAPMPFYPAHMPFCPALMPFYPAHMPFTRLLCHFSLLPCFLTRLPGKHRGFCSVYSLANPPETCLHLINTAIGIFCSVKTKNINNKKHNIM